MAILTTRFCVVIFFHVVGVCLAEEKNCGMPEAGSSSASVVSAIAGLTTLMETKFQLMENRFDVQEKEIREIREGQSRTEKEIQEIREGQSRTEKEIQEIREGQSRTETEMQEIREFMSLEKAKQAAESMSVIIFINRTSPIISCSAAFFTDDVLITAGHCVSLFPLNADDIQVAAMTSVYPAVVVSGSVATDRDVGFIKLRFVSSPPPMAIATQLRKSPLSIGEPLASFKISRDCSARLIQGSVASTVHKAKNHTFLSTTEGAIGYSGTALFDRHGKLVGIQSRSENQHFGSDVTSLTSSLGRMLDDALDSIAINARSALSLVASLIDFNPGTLQRVKDSDDPLVGCYSLFK
jgi:soluble cytochrome b562